MKTKKDKAISFIIILSMLVFQFAPATPHFTFAEDGDAPPLDEPADKEEKIEEVEAEVVEEAEEVDETEDVAETEGADVMEESEPEENEAMDAAEDAETDEVADEPEVMVPGEESQDDAAQDVAESEEDTAEADTEEAGEDAGSGDDTESTGDATIEETTEETPETSIETSTENGVEEENSTQEPVETTEQTEETNTEIVDDTVTPTNVEEPTITTGDAVAMANILNIVNTNLVNSSGWVFLENLFEDYIGSLDFRGGGNGSCSLAECNLNDVEINYFNEALLENYLTLEAGSGSNSIEGSGGTGAAINTGDAFAGLNLVNVVNTNMVGSEYLLVTLNAFRNIEGDLVFPGFANFFNAPTSAPEELVSEISNAATVANNVDVNASSGENTGVNTDITSGDAESLATLVNEVNASLIGEHSITIMLRVHGTWVGEIFGMPEGINMEVVDNNYFIGNTGGFLSNSTGTLAIEGTNNAGILNEIDIDASSGGNQIENVTSGAINTGKAYAAANIVNIANQNIIGRNWTLAIINIFGDFKGNVSFGRPDLWVGEQVEVPDTIENGSELTYKFTVMNKGDATATNVKLNDTFDATHLEILGSSAGYTDQGGILSWDIGTLAPGAATEITYNARVKDAPEGTDITNVARLALRESDNNTADNTDTATVRTTVHHRSSSRASSARKDELAQAKANAAVEKIIVSRITADVSSSSTNPFATEELTIANPTDKKIESIILYDIMHDDAQNIIQNEIWEIGDIGPHEEITISYTMQFSPNAPEATYLLSTVLSNGSTEVLHPENGRITFMQDEIVYDPMPEVLGDTDETNAEPKDIVEIIDDSEEVTSASNVAYAGEEETPTPNSGLPIDFMYLIIFGTFMGATYIGRRIMML